MLETIDKLLKSLRHALSEYGIVPAEAIGAVRNAPSTNYWINGALPGIGRSRKISVSYEHFDPNFFRQRCSSIC